MKRRGRTLRAAVLAVMVAQLIGLGDGAAADRGASHGAIDPVLARKLALTLAEVSDARAYARIREIWQTWEIADPSQVEAALASLAADGTLTPPQRVYAATLEAYARRRRGDLAGAKRQIAELGFVSQWLVVGPFENDNKSGMSERFMPELELAEPVVLDRSFDGKERPVRWRVSPDVHPYGYLDLGAMLRPRRDVCGFATAYVQGRPRDLSLWIGVAGAFRLFWNDELVLEDEDYRQLDSDRRAVGVQLREGFNRITVKLCGDESPPALALRVGERDGSVARDLTVAATEEAGTSAAARMRARLATKGGAKAPAGRRAAGARPSVSGPLDTFERELASRPTDPRLLESFARYLTITGGDAEASHQARDLARRAAEAAPTVERLLLAAKLAEDRNGQRGWIDQAAALATTGEQRAATLLARARLARSGPNWREAFPLYGELLRLEPHNVPGVLGEVDLYIEAGLKRTALARLERAVAAQPTTVALLRALAGQLRALGRDTEAAEVEARYAAMRFDDGGYLADQLRLAVARRDGAGARRWAERLLTSEPASLWAHGEVARAQVALSRSPDALATYGRALRIAPEDVATLRALADLHGVLGDRAAQVAHLQTILRISPQAKAERAYLEHIEPSSARDDEKYAWPPERFLDQRAVVDVSHPKRTLRHLTVSTVFENGLASQFKQVVFQPLTDEAAARARQYAFVYHADRQVVQLRAAKVYRKDGRVDEAIESGEAPADDPSINMYTLQRTFYVQFPRLEPGDVVELRYRIDDVAVRNQMSDYFGEIAYLQADEPIGSAEYVVIAPKGKRLHISTGPSPASGGLTSGPPKQTVTEVGDQRIYRFVSQDVKPILGEPRMPRYAELLRHVHVSTFANWTDVGAWYWRLARDKLDVDDDVRKLARSLVAGLTTDRQKVAAIYHHAATEIRYVALELGIEGIRPRRAALTLARGWGDCKDKATLIVSMLRELGIEAELVLVRTALRGNFDTTTASLAPFDHAIVYVPSLDLYLDGTAEATGTTELPAADRAVIGLRIGKGTGTLVRLPEPPPSQSRQTQTLELQLAPDGEVSFSGRRTSQGVTAPSWRQRYHTEASRRERAASDLAGDLGPVELLGGKAGLTVSDLDALEAPVELSFAGSATAKRDGKALSLPLGPSLAMVGQFASRPARHHDLLVGPLRENEETWTVILPPGFRVLSSPQSVVIQSPFGSYELDVKLAGRKVTAHSVLRLTKPRIAPHEYGMWRQFCQRVDGASTPRLLVEK